MSDENCCKHDVHCLDYCPICDGQELSDDDSDVIAILLEHAMLTGAERDRLEDMAEQGYKDPESLQMVLNQHISTLHQHQK